MIGNLHEAFLNSTGICTDTRHLQPGEIFFALKGPSFNGNTYAAQALEQGARAVVVDEDIALPGDARVFQVEDVLDALQELAHFHRSSLKNIRFVSLTGSNGKTTTKELMKSVCSQALSAYATVGNLNNHIGVPLTLLRIPVGCQVAIVELGANHKGEIGHLSALVQPDIGYITNFGKAHLEGFGSVQGVIEGKSELYSQLRETGGIALVNVLDPVQMELTEGMKRVTFGGPSADYPMIFSDSDTAASVSWNGADFTSQLTGRFHAANIGAAIALALHLGLSPEDIRRGIAAYEPQNNRSEWRTTGKNIILLDAYNANPNSMDASIRAFMHESPESRLLILGDMFEIGESSAREHQLIVDLLRELNVDYAFLIGKDFHACKGPENYRKFPSTEACLEFVQSKPITGYHILLKGSRGMHLESLLSEL